MRSLAVPHFPHCWGIASNMSCAVVLPNIERSATP
jgi:hypothetical protein